MLRLLTGFAALLTTQFFSTAAPSAENDYNTYWFYLTTPLTVERPLIGMCFLDWSKAGNVKGDLTFDTQDRSHPKLEKFQRIGAAKDRFRCLVTGANRDSRNLRIIVHTLVPHGADASFDSATAGAELLAGTLTKQIQEGRITWSGKLRVKDNSALLKCIGVDGLKDLRMSELPKEWDLAMISGRHLEAGGIADAGIEERAARAIWAPRRDEAAQQWLNEHGVEFEKCDREATEAVPGLKMWCLTLPAFTQNLTIYQMLRSGIFDEVGREVVGAGPGESYSIFCPQSSVFSHPPQSAEGVAEALAFAQKFVADMAALQRFRGTRFSDPVVVRTHQFRFSLEGLSSTMSNGPRGYWERDVLELSLYRSFGQSSDAITIDLIVHKAERAKGPANVEPPLERFDDLQGSSSVLLTALGTELGSKVKATQQGLINGD